MLGIDVFALILGLVLLFIIIFALIGVYARRQNGGGASASSGEAKAAA